MKTTRIVYWIATGMFCLLMGYSVGMYLMNTETIRGVFEAFDYPSYIVIPLAIAKILGVIMLLTRKIPWLTEWAYAGFFFDIILAFFAHFQADDDVTTPLLAMVLLLISYFFGKTVRPMYG